MPATQPTKTAGDLGEPLSNTRVPKANELSAVNLEKIKDWIIAFGLELGLTDGTTVGSVWKALASALLDSDFAGAELGRLTRTGVGAYGVVKDNTAAVAPPSVTDDSSAGYSVGSLWIAPGAGAAVCIDATVGAAVWVPIPDPSASVPAAVAAAGAVGTGQSFARSDHVHAHGDQAGGTLHSEATTALAGFLSADDKDLIYERGKNADYFAEFRNYTQWNEGYQSVVSGAGATVTAPASAPAQPCYGTVYLGKGTTATGAAAIYVTRSPLLASNGRWRLAFRIYIGTLATVADDFQILFGATNGNTSSSPTVGCWFAYAGSGSPNWRARTTRVTQTDTDTGVAVAVGWNDFAIEFDQAGGHCYFYINGVQAADATTNLPLATDYIGPNLNVNGIAGALDRGFYCDYVHERAPMGAGR